MQVFLGNRRVGEANVAPRPGQNVMVFPIINEPVFTTPGALPVFEPARELRLKMDWAYFRVDNMSEELYGPGYLQQVFKKHGVSEEDCEKHERFESHSTVYRYRVLCIEEDDYEDIFDMDWFTPAEGEIDYEALAERRKRQLMMGGL